MTSGDIAKIKEKHQSVFKNIYSVCDAETGKQIIFACGEDDLRKQLGLKTDDELHGFVLDVKEGRNAKYKVKLNYLDISDPFAPNASTISLGEKLLSKQEAFDYFVLRDVGFAVSEELRTLESYLILPKEKRVVPNGFSDWEGFKGYYKQLEKWHRYYTAGFTKKLPPLREGEKVVHSGASGVYETPTQKAAGIGCGIIGIAWFAFIGVSFLICVMMKIHGCISDANFVPRDSDASEKELEYRWH